MGKSHSSEQKLRPLIKNPQQIVPSVGFEYEAIRLKGKHLKFYISDNRIYFEIQDEAKSGNLDCIFRIYVGNYVNSKNN